VTWVRREKKNALERSCRAEMHNAVSLSLKNLPVFCVSANPERVRTKILKRTPIDPICHLMEMHSFLAGYEHHLPPLHHRPCDPTAKKVVLTSSQHERHAFCRPATSSHSLQSEQRAPYFTKGVQYNGGIQGQRSISPACSHSVMKTSLKFNFFGRHALCSSKFLQSYVSPSAKVPKQATWCWINKIPRMRHF